jgi:hypothetical protein
VAASGILRHASVELQEDIKDIKKDIKIMVKIFSQAAYQIFE